MKPRVKSVGFRARVSVRLASLMALWRERRGEMTGTGLVVALDVWSSAMEY